nr:uncharacterized protein LOC119179286 [Rhipicephalus microplus]
MLRRRSLPLATADALGSVFVHQTVYVFPPPGQLFDPNCVRLVTRGRDPATAVACMLGFFKLVCEDGYKQMVRASEVDDVWLNDVHVSGVFVRRELRSLFADSEPTATMDDFYVLLSVLLCNLPRARGSNLNRDWFQNRINDLVELFPGVSEPPPVPLYGAEQADAISNFSEKWRHTRAALCRALLRSRFEGPMRQVQEYVSAGWRFAGMKHVQLILEFLHGRNSWVLDIIPELRAKGDQLQGFLKAYQRLGADGPYMKLLHLPEAATASRKRLGLHVAAAYAFAVLEDDNWLQYRGVPRDEAEEAVLAKITAIKRMGLGAPPRNGPSAVAPRDDDDDTRGVDVAAAGEPAAHASLQPRLNDDEVLRRSAGATERAGAREVAPTAAGNRGEYSERRRRSEKAAEQRLERFPRPRHQRGLALVRCAVPTWTSSYAVASLAISLPSPDVDAGPKSRSRVRRAGMGVDGDSFCAL